jgi:hypothetical protein
MESISHDITTPIRFLVSISQKLNDIRETELQKKYLDEICHTSEQLFKFTLDLKEYTVLFKEENIFDNEEQHIVVLVENKKLLFEQVASTNNSSIHNLCDPNLTTRINKGILSAILHNLIDNAVKNTKDGEILVKTEQKNKKIEIIIFDTGKHTRAMRAINFKAWHYWKIIYDRAKPGQYLFSFNQMPNDTPVKANSLYDMSAKYLRMAGLNLTGYCLKYTYLNLVSNKYGISIAKELAGHTTEKTTKIYAVDYEEQQVEKNKNIYICI